MTLREKSRALAAVLKDLNLPPGHEWETRATELIERMAADNNADLLKLHKERGARIEKLEWALDQANAAVHQSGAMMAEVEKAFALTKREQFAAMALQGLLAAGAPPEGEPPDLVPAMAGLAVDMADALTEALEAKR